MKLDTSHAFGNTSYAFKDREIAAMLAESGADISEASPLHEVDISVLARTQPEETNELQEALAVLSKPNRTIRLRTWPEGGGWITYYGAEGQTDLAAHARNAETGENLIIWPITEAMLRSQLKAPLTSDATTLPHDVGNWQGLEMTLTFAEFLGLASLVDSYQEMRLRALADRDPEPEMRFVETTLEKAYAKGLKSSEDVHWTVSRLTQGFEVAFPKRLPKAKATLEQFEASRILIEGVEGRALLPSTELLMRRLAELVGFSALSVYHHKTGQTERRLYQANSTQIFLYAFEGDAPDSVQLTELSRQVLSDDLAALLPSAIVQKPSPEPTSVCPSCGADFAEGQSFCAACGANLSAKPAPEPAPTPNNSLCAKCGAPLEGGLKFCTECGHPVKPL